jgi:hypothetical protein
LPLCQLVCHGWQTWSRAVNQSCKLTKGYGHRQVCHFATFLGWGVAAKIFANCSCTNSLPFCSARVAPRLWVEGAPGHVGHLRGIPAISSTLFPTWPCWPPWDNLGDFCDYCCGPWRREPGPITFPSKKIATHLNCSSTNASVRTFCRSLWTTRYGISSTRQVCPRMESFT